MPLRYFYSRPRVGGDYILQRCEMANAISTHAPAWGATESMSLGRKQRIISTHAPAWGATSPAGTTVGGSNNFYSRPRVGGDLPQTLRHSKLPYFYSRPRVGGDHQGERPAGLLPISTHAPAWGATGGGHERGALRAGISTHAPAWGATRAARAMGYKRLVFLLTPPRGGRPGFGGAYE